MTSSVANVAYLRISPFGHHLSLSNLELLPDLDTVEKNCPPGLLANFALAQGSVDVLIYVKV